MMQGLIDIIRSLANWKDVGLDEIPIKLFKIARSGYTGLLDVVITI